MEELKSLPTEAGLQRVTKKPIDDPEMVIDLDDEIEEEEEWEPGLVRTGSNIGKGDEEVTAVTNSQEEVDGKHNEEEEKGKPGLVGTADNPIWFWPIFDKNNKDDILRTTSIDLDDPEVLVAIMDDDNMDCSFVESVSQKAEVVDLSSSESGDEGDGDINAGYEVAEEQEEIITTLSREDTAKLAVVMKSIKEGGGLGKFKVDHLKTYLRHYGLRMVGVKFVLLNRIQEHLRIKDGRAEEIYPRESFSIDCKGDVCLGDTVLFLQTVYGMPFDYEIRCASGPPLGKRWVAGKVVSESYGAGKQQHTFTIEVLWSTGIQPFYCMRPVKIKGRNLYRMVTMRQPWSNEAERQKVLDEKHARGAAARAHRRAVKGLKAKDSRVHPYSRPHEAESHGIPPRTTQQNIHSDSNAHQGSVPTHPAPGVPLHSGMQHGTYTEQRVYQTFMATNTPAPPTTPGLNPMQPRRSSDTQQSEWHNIKHLPAPAYPAHGHPPPRPHAQDSRQHGRSFQPREYQGTSDPAHGHPSPRAHAQDSMQHGRSFHTRQKDYQGNSDPAHDHPPLRVHVQYSLQQGRIHTQRQTSSQHPGHSNHEHHQQGKFHIPCSNSGCENPGAKQCITRSCGACCKLSRNTTTGRCQRHR